MEKLETECAFYKQEVLPSFGETYRQELYLVKLALRFLSGESLTLGELDSLKGYYFSDFLCLPDIQRTEYTKQNETKEWRLDEWIEITIEWASGNLAFCRKTTSSFAKFQKASLKRIYAPGRNKAKEAAERFYSRANK